MLRFSFAALAAPLALALPPAPVREFRIDAGHSDVAFSIGFLGHPVRGRFSDIRGLIAYSAGNPSASAVTVVIGAKSIATGSDHRDQHLRTSDFFDVVFRSNRSISHIRKNCRSSVHTTAVQLPSGFLGYRTTIDVNG
jgi:polyisoprenoid-binding protein YceI